eukprot:gene19668-23553_t
MNLYSTIILSLVLLVSLTTADTTLWVDPSSTNFNLTCGQTTTPPCPDIYTAILAYNSASGAPNSSDILYITTNQSVSIQLTAANNTNIHISNINVDISYLDIDLEQASQFIVIAPANNLTQLSVAIHHMTLKNAGASQNTGAIVSAVGQVQLALDTITFNGCNSTGAIISVQSQVSEESSLTVSRSVFSGNAVGSVMNLANVDAVMVSTQYISNYANGVASSLIDTLGGSLLIHSCDFNSSVVVSGPAVVNYGASASELNVLNSTFTNNNVISVADIDTLTSGPAIILSVSQASVNQSSFSFNNVAALVFSANATIGQSEFFNNTAVYGAVCVVSNSNVTIVDCQMNNNTAHQNGGAIMAVDGSIVTILNSTLAYNFAGHDGGSIFTNGSRITMNNTILIDNQASSEGNDIYCEAGKADIMPAINLKNITRQVSHGTVIDCNSGAALQCRLSGDIGKSCPPYKPSGALMAIVICGLAVGFCVLGVIIWVMKKRYENGRRALGLPVD